MSFFVVNACVCVCNPPDIVVIIVYQREEAQRRFMQSECNPIAYDPDTEFTSDVQPFCLL